MSFVHDEGSNKPPIGGQMGDERYKIFLVLHSSQKFWETKSFLGKNNVLLRKRNSFDLESEGQFRRCMNEAKGQTSLGEDRPYNKLTKAKGRLHKKKAL